MHPNVHSSTVYNSQDMKATYMSIGRWMDKKAAVHTYNGTLLSHKKEQTGSFAEMWMDLESVIQREIREKQILFINVYMWNEKKMVSDQISWVAQSCPTTCDPMNCSTPGLPVQHQLPEFTETHVHWVSDALQPSHPLSSPSPLSPNPSQHQSLSQWVNSSHEVAKVLEFQL